MSAPHYPILRSRKTDSLYSVEGALRVRFEPGFGTNVYVERWASPDKGPEFVKESLGFSITGWESLCELVHEYEAWKAAPPGPLSDTGDKGEPT